MGAKIINSLLALWQGWQGSLVGFLRCALVPLRGSAVSCFLFLVMLGRGYSLNGFFA
jgi:hypothetical protein